MGSVFLYLAIVLMWLCVLVPMWLRRDRDDEAELVSAFAADDTASDAGVIPGSQAAGAADAAGTTEGDTLSEPAPGSEASTPDGGNENGDSDPGNSDPGNSEASSSGPGGSEAGGSAAGGGEVGDNPVTPPPLPAGVIRRRIAARRRARIIARRRRRTLWSILLVIASAITAATGVVSWWGVIPSVTLLFGYLVMLRVAVRIDAERRAAAARARAERARRRRARREALALAAQQTAAEVLEFDASRRVELFDQYADPPRRAVGD